MNKGIVIAGNILTDIVKTIDAYPKIGMLSNISSLTRGVGGCVPNTAINLAKIDSTIPLSAIGKIGDDDNGKYVVSELKKYGINTDGVVTSKTAPTSFSDVMSIRGGERTFFHARGANAEFSPEDIDLSAIDCDIFHIGYILLLDIFDKPDEEYGTVMARFLKSVQDKGIKTSIDAVSDSTTNYGEKIKPTFRYCDYVIINEVECTKAWDIEGTDQNGDPIVPNIRKAMELTLEAGVREKVIVHCKKMSFSLDKSGEFTVCHSLRIPKDKILGSVGAGDSFCAGSLYSLYHGLSDKELLEFSSAAAGCNLFAENSTDGMLPKEEILKILAQYSPMS